MGGLGSGWVAVIIEESLRLIIRPLMQHKVVWGMSESPTIKSSIELFIVKKRFLTFYSMKSPKFLNNIIFF